MRRRNPRSRRQAGRTTHMEELQHAQLERNWTLFARSTREMRSDREAIYTDTATRRNPCGKLLLW